MTPGALRSAARLAFVSAVFALSGSGCSLNLKQSDDGQLVRNECEDDSKCPGGTCWNGMCVANQGFSAGVLIEVVPPTSVGSEVGGMRFAPTPNSVVSLTQSSSDFKIHLPLITDVDAFLLFDPPLPSGCSSLRVTLTPLEEGYGLPAVSYVADAAPVATVPAACSSQYSNSHGVEFKVSVAPGKYDVYVESASSGGDSGSSSCDFVPRLIREVPVATTTCLPTAQPRPLKVKIQWPAGSAGLDSLQGWAVDVLHPTTGQILSNRKVVPAQGTVELQYADVTVVAANASAMAEDSSQDLVRLSPPPGITAPVIQFVRSGLEALSTPNDGVTPPLGPFPAPVHINGWVYREDQYNGEREPGDGSVQSRSVPVPSTVTFTATKIAGITPGIFASFSTILMVGKDGTFDGTVVPGEYRVRAVPQSGLGLAAVETSLSVRCNQPANAPSCVSLGSTAPLLTEAGKTILVPNAATLSGSIDVPYGGGQMRGAMVQATPAAFGRQACVGRDGGVADAGGSDAGCAVSKVGVLSTALGEDAFVPRPSSAPVAGASFRLPEVDCGGCGDGLPAFFDIVVRSQEGSRFPWLLDTGIAVAHDVDVGQLELPLPIVEQGVVDIPHGPEAPPTPVPGALISAYVLRDDLGAYIDDPEGMKSCTSVGTGQQQPGTRCIRSVLQVAETRADNDGSFVLVLPSSVQ